jgi:hypothetical protein
VARNFLLPDTGCPRISGFGFSLQIENAKLFIGMLPKEMRIDNRDIGKIIGWESKHGLQKITKQIAVAFVSEKEPENNIVFGRQEVPIHGCVLEKVSLIQQRSRSKMSQFFS